MSYATSTLQVLETLRPPFARSATLLFPFSREGAVNNGITVELPPGEPAVACGDGQVDAVYAVLPRWATTNPTLRTTAVHHVLVNHGSGVKTLVSGLRTCAVRGGQTLSRGTVLGTLLTDQLFVEVQVNNRPINPSNVNLHWLTQNGAEVIGQGGRIRFAPDALLRDLSQGVAVTLTNGLKYFKQALGPAPLLVNVACNGDGSMAGRAADGITDVDYWNVYEPVDFSAAVDSTCIWPYYGYNAYEFSAPPVLNLLDHAGRPSPVLLERVAPQFSAAGTMPGWSPLLAAWIGGYVGPVPYENSFRLRNLPAGDYALYLYANQGVNPQTSTFYVSISGGAPEVFTTDPVAVSAYVESRNYFRVDLSLSAGQHIIFKAVGYLSGLQLRRTG